MEQSQLVKIIMVLKIAYPYHFKDMTKEDVYAMTSIYQKQFKEFHPTMLMNTVNVLIKKCTYMPSIAELYQECRNQEAIFYKKVLELSGEFENKKFLSDMIDWYRIQDSFPPEIKNEIMGHYKKLKEKEVLMLEQGGI